ncbi:MAG: hypothetical protein ABI573_10185 [Chloroflexota bacterium]
MFISRTSRWRTLAASGALLSLILAACAGGGSPAPATGSPGPTVAPTSTPTTAPPSTEPIAVLLQVTSEGGFINPSSQLAALPTVVVYSDGRVLTRAASPTSNPDPLLPRVSIRDLGPTGAAAILAAIQAAALDKPSTEDPGISADSGVTVFAVTSGGSVTTTRYAASGGGPGLPGGGGGGPGKTAAFDLLNRLLDTTDAWGGTAPAETVYQPLGYRVFAAAAAADPSAPAPVAWPLTESLADIGTPTVPDRGVAGLRSGVVLGADAATLGPVLDAAAAGTTFTSSGTTFTVWVRPLLPHELPG